MCWESHVEVKDTLKNCTKNVNVFATILNIDTNVITNIYHKFAPSIRLNKNRADVEHRNELIIELINAL